MALLAELSARGLQQAKLEGVGSFAGNVLILIQAKSPLGGGGGEAEDTGQRSGGQRSKVVTASDPAQAGDGEKIGGATLLVQVSVLYYTLCSTVQTRTNEQTIIFS